MPSYLHQVCQDFTETFVPLKRAGKRVEKYNNLVPCVCEHIVPNWKLAFRSTVTSKYRRERLGTQDIKFDRRMSRFSYPMSESSGHDEDSIPLGTMPIELPPVPKVVRNPQDPVMNQRPLSPTAEHGGITAEALKNGLEAVKRKPKMPKDWKGKSKSSNNLGECQAPEPSTEISAGQATVAPPTAVPGSSRNDKINGELPESSDRNTAQVPVENGSERGAERDADSSGVISHNVSGDAAAQPEAKSGYVDASNTFDDPGFQLIEIAQDQANGDCNRANMNTDNNGNVSKDINENIMKNIGQKMTNPEGSTIRNSSAEQDFMNCLDDINSLFPGMFL